MSEFQSTFPRGERPGQYVKQPTLIGFQSTFPRGERRSIAACVMASTPYFNPRSRVGNDRCRLNQYSNPSNFNPRSRVGNDLIYLLKSIHLTISIHVPAWGTTPCVCAYSLSAVFQSTFPRGERPSLILILAGYMIFQSTFPRGERR